MPRRPEATDYFGAAPPIVKVRCITCGKIVTPRGYTLHDRNVHQPHERGRTYGYDVVIKQPNGHYA